MKVFPLTAAKRQKSTFKTIDLALKIVDKNLIRQYLLIYKPATHSDISVCQNIIGLLSGSKYLGRLPNKPQEFPPHPPYIK